MKLSKIIEESIAQRTKRVAKELLNTTPKKMFEMYEKGQIKKGSIAETEIESILWLMDEK